MGLLDRFRSNRRARSGPRAENSYFSGDLTDPQLQEFMRSGGMTSGSGQIITPDSSMRIAAANRCVILISGAIGSMPIDVMMQTDPRTTKVQSNHPVQDILKQSPNGWQTPNEFMRLLVSSLLLRGNFYGEKIRSADAKLVGLLPLMGGMTVTLQGGQLSYDYIRQDGTRKTYAQKDILHVRGYSRDGITGLSVIQHAKESLGLSASTWRHAGKLFRSGAAVSGVISHPKKLLDDVRTRLYEMLDKFRGADSEQSYQDLILDDGLKFDRVAMSSVDAQMLEVMELSQSDIAMFFGVPPHMIGVLNKTTSFGAGIEQMSMGFVTYTLQDWITNICQALKRDLLIAEGDKAKLFIKMDTAPLLMGDSAARTALYGSAIQYGWMNADEIRFREGYDPIPDGKGEIYLRPANLVPAGTVTPVATAAASPPPPPDPGTTSKKAV